MVLGLVLVGLTGTVAGAGAAWQDNPLPEGNAYLRSLLSEQRQQDDAISDYTYDLLEVRENLDKNDIATSKTSLRYEVFYVKTRQIRRLVARNGQPLSAKEQASVDHKASERAQAIREGQVVTEQAGVRLSRLFPSFDFKTVGRREFQDRSALEFTFRPLSEDSQKKEAAGIGDDLLRQLSGRVVIDERDKRVIRLDAQSSDDIRAKIATGVKLRAITFAIQFVLLEDKVWLPARVDTFVTARAFFFKTVRIRQTSTYSNYRKFRVDTRRISGCLSTACRRRESDRPHPESSFATPSS